MKSRKPFFRTILLALTGALSESGVAADVAPSAQILYPAGSQQSFKGPDTYFTGDVQVDMLFPGNDTAHYSGAYPT